MLLNNRNKEKSVPCLCVSELCLCSKLTSGGHRLSLVRDAANLSFVFGAAISPFVCYAVMSDLSELWQ